MRTIGTPASWTSRLATACSPALRRRARRDDGFTLIEVMVAIGVFAVVATFMSHLMAGGMKGVLLGKRREVATQEANRTIEIARSLSYDAIGLVESDPTIGTDTAIEEHDGAPSYRSDTDWEPLIWANNPLDHPFNPHVLDVTRGATELTRYIYVTGVDSDGDDAIDLKRVSVRVSWNESGTAGPANDVRVQTLINESGLVVTGPGTSGGGPQTTPPPPCAPQPCTTTGLTPLTADTQTEAGTFNVKTDEGMVAGLVDAVLPTDPASFKLPATTGNSTYRAVSDITCSGKSAEFVGPTQKYGGHPVQVTADDDPTTAEGPSPSPDPWLGFPPDQINLGDEIDDVLAESTTVSPVNCQATGEDKDLQPPTDDSLPYEKGTASALGILNLTQDLTGLGLPSDTLTAVKIASAPISQEIDHQNVATQREVYANSAAAMGELQVMQIPAVFPEGLVKVDGLNYSASVRGAAGTPSTAPSVSASVINLRVYDVGNEVSGCSSRSGPYCLMTVNPGASGFTGLSIEYEHSVLDNDVELSLLTELVYEVHVDILPPAKDPVDGVVGPNGERRWSAEYTPMTISARLKANLTVPLVGDVLLTDTQVDLTPGSVRSEACGGATCL